MASAESRHESVRAPGEHYRVAGFACLICPGRGCRGKWVLKDRTRTQARDLELCAFRTQRQVRSFVPDILGYKSCLSPQYMLSYWIKLVLRPIKSRQPGLYYHYYMQLRSTSCGNNVCKSMPYRRRIEYSSKPLLFTRIPWAIHNGYSLTFRRAYIVF